MTLLGWEKTHIPWGFSRQDVINGPRTWNTVYSLPVVPGVLPVREMNVQVYDVGGGASVIMADAMVSWQPPRPAWEVIPGSVTMVTIAVSWSAPGIPAPVTITSVPVVRQLAALVNGLPVSTLRTYPPVPCPGAAGFALTFRAAAGGPAVAVADGPAGCGVVHLSLSGKDEPDLQPPRSYLDTVLKIAGLRWKLG